MLSDENEFLNKFSVYEYITALTSERGDFIMCFHMY